MAVELHYDDILANQAEHIHTSSGLLLVGFTFTKFKRQACTPNVRSVQTQQNINRHNNSRFLWACWLHVQGNELGECGRNSKWVDNKGRLLGCWQIMGDGLDIVANGSWTWGTIATDGSCHIFPSSDILTHLKQFRHPKARGNTFLRIAKKKKIWFYRRNGSEDTRR